MNDKVERLERRLEAQEEKVEAMKKELMEAEILYDALDDEEAENPSNRKNKRIVEKYNRAKEDLDAARAAARAATRDIQTQIHLAVEELKNLGTP